LFWLHCFLSAFAAFPWLRIVLRPVLRPVLRLRLATRSALRPAIRVRKRSARRSMASSLNCSPNRAALRAAPFVNRALRLRSALRPVLRLPLVVRSANPPARTSSSAANRAPFRALRSKVSSATPSLLLLRAARSAHRPAVPVPRLVNRLVNRLALRFRLAVRSVTEFQFSKVLN